MKYKTIEIKNLDLQRKEFARIYGDMFTYCRQKPNTKKALLIMDYLWEAQKILDEGKEMVEKFENKK